MDEPEARAPDAVHELMRYRPIIFGASGEPPKTSNWPESAFLPAPSWSPTPPQANRDPDVGEDPERLDITRQNQPAILNFGAGVHYCLGAHLARPEQTEALRVITRRMPNPRQTGPSPWKGMAAITGPLSVPLEFD